VDVVKDSSRYFVLRAVNPQTNQVALLGVGFRERDFAYNFQSALGDHVKRVLRLRGVKTQPGGGEDEQQQDADATAVAADVARLSLKQPIKINIPGVEKRSSSSSSGGGGGLLAPPPPAGVLLPPPPATVKTKVDDEEWGDFN
jgi:hypothetical protein